jgi:hypothetical protein
VYTTSDKQAASFPPNLVSNPQISPMRTQYDSIPSKLTSDYSSGEGGLSFDAIPFHSVRCGKSPIPMWLKAESARVQHHAITELAESQASERTIMSAAGHVSRQMLEHYSHIRLDAKRQAVEALSQRWSEPQK